MLRDLNWKTLEGRRTISRLTLLHKSVHNIVAINIDEHYTNHEEKNITTRKRLQFPLLILLPEIIATCTLILSPTTVHPICGDLIVVLDRNIKRMWLSGTVNLLL